MKDMIEVGGVMRPSTYEKAMELAEAQETPILKAREKVYAAQREVLQTCIHQYPVGSRVSVSVDSLCSCVMSPQEQSESTRA